MARSAAPALSLLILLASCGDDGTGQEGALAPAAESGAEKVECAVGGAEAFEPVCTVEREVGANGLTLTIRAPGGGFRRLQVTRDGRGVVAADGAHEATVRPVAQDRIEVEIAGDRYRLPATVRQ